MWSSDEIDAALIYYLRFLTTEVSPQDSADKFYGHPVRCIEIMQILRVSAVLVIVVLFSAESYCCALQFMIYKSS